jgi:hypothetical protein
MSLEQSGGSVTGTVTVKSSPCLANGDLSATLTNDDLAGAVTAGGLHMTFDATVTASQMSGTYNAAAAGACSNDTGSFIASR